MIRAACHCTAVRFEVAELPSWVLDCNCSVCRRYGAIWAYPEAGKVSFVSGADATDTYIWGDEEIAFHRCKTCGCLTHTIALDAKPPQIYSINVRMIPTLDPARVPLRQIDNGGSGFFWTRSSTAPRPGIHRKMDPPGPEDWR